jgi:hypothetical protein
MSPFPAFLVAAAIQSVPCEYVFDFGAEAVPFKYRMLITLTARDGTTLDDLDIEFSADADPAGSRDFLFVAFRDCEWAVRRGPGNTVIVTGLSTGTKSPIRAAVIRSEKAIPLTARRVPLAPPKKK